MSARAGPSAVLPWLSVGSYWDAAPARLQERGFTHALNVRGGAIPAYPAGRAYKCKPLSDYGQTELLSVADSIVAFLSRVKATDGQKALVYCQQSVNRSPTAVLLYLLHPRGENLCLRDALSLLLARHPLTRPHPSYMQQLLALDERWHGAPSLTDSQAEALLASPPACGQDSDTHSNDADDPELAARTASFTAALAELFAERTGKQSDDERCTLLTATINAEQYERRRRLWNGLIERKPAAIVCPLGAHDVVQVVRLARRFNARLSVRGGGHNVAGLALQDGVVAVDLCHLRSVRYDAATQLVHVGGGATWRDVDRELTGHRRACVAGLVSHTGVAGLTLGGGIGWLSRLHGLACDGLVAAELVTGTGELLAVDGERPAQLLWALRGGGGNFGVCTSLTLRTHAVHAVHYALVYWDNSCPANRAGRDAIVGAYERYCRSAALPAWASAYCWLTAGSTLIIFADVVDTADDEAPRYDQQQQRLAELLDGRAGAPPPSYADVQSMSMAELNARFDDGNKHGDYYYWSRSTLLPEGLPPDFASQVAGPLVDSQPDITVELMHLGGRLLADDAASAFFQRPNLRCFECHAIAARRLHAHAGETTTRRQYIDRWRPALQGFVAKLAAYSTTGGSYLNIEPVGPGQSLLSDVYGSAWQQLRQLKSQYDPDNVFAYNHNIPPL